MICKKKRAFTMIELIFIIIALGVLSALAIPRMSIQREDAEGTATKQEIDNTVKAAILQYGYTGSFSGFGADITGKLRPGKWQTKNLGNGTQVIYMTAPALSGGTTGTSCVSIWYIDTPSAASATPSDPLTGAAIAGVNANATTLVGSAFLTDRPIMKLQVLESSRDSGGCSTYRRVFSGNKDGAYVEVVNP